MAELITGIYLSSGRLIELPVFPDMSTQGAHYVKATRAKAVIGVFNPYINFQLYSDSELLELGNILRESNRTTFHFDTGVHEGPAVAAMCWVCDQSGYKLKVPFVATATAMTCRCEEYGRSFGHYYDNDIVVSQYDDPDVLHWNTALPYYDEIHSDRVLYNVRPSSAGIYSYDIASRGGVTINTAGTTLSLTVEQLAQRIVNWNTDHPDDTVSIRVYDPESNDDPYIVDDPASFGGGFGEREDPDEIEKATIPPLPSLSAVDTGLVTMYGATGAQLQALGAYLWSNLWDVETNFKKLFASPMDCICGLSIVPVTPALGGGQNVKFGNINTSIALNVLTSQYVEVDCGSINIKEYIGSFLDYSPYVNISIYLPYIGYRELSPDDVMNDTIHVVYHVDCLSGGCCAMIETGKKGLLYSFNGSCICNVPITAINYSGAIQNAVSAVGAGLTTAAGIATGAAPIAAVGAASMLSSAANTAMNSKPTIQRSGAMGGAAGLMSYQKPLLVVTRPRMSVPDKLNKFVGLTTNVTMNLSQCTGFTQVELIHLENVPCTQEEREELLSLLRTGVIF